MLGPGCDGFVFTWPHGSAARAMLRVIPPKTAPWNGQIATSTDAEQPTAGGTAALCVDRRVAFAPTPSRAKPGRVTASPRASQQPSGSISSTRQSRVTRRRTAVGIAPPAAQTNATDDPVDDAAHVPGEREGVQQRCPPIPSITRHRASGAARTVVLRSSRTDWPPAQSGSVGNGSLGAPGTPRRTTGWRRSLHGLLQGQFDGPLEPDQAIGGSGTYAAMSCSWHTTSCRSDSTRVGPASPAPASPARPTGWTTAG